MTAPTSCVVLNCGAVVLGEPHDTESYRQTAIDLGYGSDIEAMCRDHDTLHQALANWLGIADSYALLASAGLLNPEDTDIAVAEEHAVLAVQKYVRLSGVRMPAVG